MKIQVLASGSKGNCYLLEGARDRILLECGIPISRIKKGLSYDLKNIVGCLVTHEHQDHCRAINDILKLGIDVYTSSKTAEVLGLTSHRLKPVESKRQYQVGEFDILAFDVEHDAVDPLGFFIKSSITGETVLFITDTYYCKYKFRGITHLMIECNYDREILQSNVDNGKIRTKQYERLLKSHMSFENCKEFLRANVLDECTEIYLLHTSERNSNPDVFQKEIENITGIRTIVAGG